MTLARSMTRFAHGATIALLLAGSSAFAAGDPLPS